MKIHIQENEGFKIRLWFPTSIIKSKFIVKTIRKYSKNSIDIEPVLTLLPTIHKSIKTYIKKNGHFILVDVDSQEGYKVQIKI